MIVIENNQGTIIITEDIGKLFLNNLFYALHCPAHAPDRCFFWNGNLYNFINLYKPGYTGDIRGKWIYLIMHIHLGINILHVK